MKDLVIIGAGPAGTAAAVYAARKQLKTTLVTETWGGQSTVSTDIKNWIGTKSVSGSDLAKMLEEHVKDYEGEYLNFVENVKVDKIEKNGEIFTTTINNGETIESRAVLITTGSSRRKLDVPGSKELDNKGVMYCASCDGPIFSGQDVAVIGGGNAALEAVVELSEYCKSVTLIHRRTEYKADKITVDKALAKNNVASITPVDITELKGDGMLDTIVYKNKETGEENELKVTGLFVEIGLIPATDFAKDIVEMNGIGQIKIDPLTQQTETSGVWAAGDCTDVLYHQNNIAAGDGVVAIEDIYIALNSK